MGNKVTSKTAGIRHQILFDVMNKKSVSIIVDKSSGEEDSETGKLIVKAGTPMTGDLTDRTKAFKAASGIATLAEGDEGGSTTTTPTTTTSPVQGVLLHDVDVTNGDENGTLLIWGFVNLDRLDTDVATLALSQASDLDGKIWFLKDN